MKSILLQEDIYHDVSQELLKDYSPRKQASREYSNTDTEFFRNLFVESLTCSDERKVQIERTFKQAQKMTDCALNIEHIFAYGKDSEGNEKIESKLLDIKTCSLKKCCSICAAAEGLKNVLNFISYALENPNLIAYPFTISPPNYHGDTCGERVENAQNGTEKIYKNVSKFLRDNTRSRGTPGAKLVISQLRNNTACFWSKEFEPASWENGFQNFIRKYKKSMGLEDNRPNYIPGEPEGISKEERERVFNEACKAGEKNKETLNCHWHGIIFMKIDSSGSYKNTLDYKSFREMIKCANGGVDCQVEIGNTRGAKKPLVHRDLINDDGTISKEAIKAFLEVTKYITKMPVGETKEDFERRQELIWEVNMRTYRYNFVKKSGDLVGYKPPVEIQIWKPDRVAHHTMTYEDGEYKESMQEIGQFYASTCYYQMCRLDLVQMWKEDLEERMHLMTCDEKLKKARSQLKGYKTEIDKLIAAIQYHVEISAQNEDLIQNG